ncbi:helix-turn-helix transcriptional regulator [uncultured Oceanicoccus sp.]|uniref:helix-turn-helix transcriptional regulator n=1 Tax=uncultured Oceanicoccus sp. TaxID=1706381 RepID=UPI0030DD5059
MIYFDCYRKLNDSQFDNIKVVESQLRHHIRTEVSKVVLGVSPRKLTITEEQVCVGLALGLSAKEIAKVRGSSNRTVETHIARIKIKIGCKRLPPVLLVQLAQKFFSISTTHYQFKLAL